MSIKILINLIKITKVLKMIWGSLLYIVSILCLYCTVLYKISYLNRLSQRILGGIFPIINPSSKCSYTYCSGYTYIMLMLYSGCTCSKQDVDIIICCKETSFLQWSSRKARLQRRLFLKRHSVRIIYPWKNTSAIP